MLTITSRENPQIKQVCGLLSSSRRRRKEGLFVCEGFTLLEEALRRGAVSCYARDGVYPPTLEELLRRSGVLLDETRYAVDYQIFAENLMPEITVLERGDLG